MNKILIGLILGAVLGVVDGATAWFTPEVRKDMLGIIIGSTIKGVIAGVAAGMFARKVRSTPAGIVFGLAVGLALAYAVVYMGGGKYFFEIMLPGGIVGAILGWATQRYGRPSAPRHAAAAVALALIALFGAGADAGPGHDHGKPAPNAVFEKLKALEGTWDAAIMKPDGDRTTVVYRVAAGGSVVQETMFAGTPYEMINMFTLDGEGLTATHYCSGGNQPTLRFNAAKSKENEVVFDFVGVRGKNTGSYINGVTFVFENGKVVERWRSSDDSPEKTLYLNARR